MRTIISLAILLVAVAALAIGAAARLSALGPDTLKYEKEWVVALLQVGLIAMLGAVTTGVLELFKDNLQRGRDQSKLRLEALTAFRGHYHAVKLIRRKVQATGKFDAEYVESLNQIQLALEGLRDESDIFTRYIEIRGALSQMERYLNRVANEPQSPERTGFPDSSLFKPFSTGYKNASHLMRTDIIPRTLRARLRAVCARFYDTEA